MKRPRINQQVRSLAKPFLERIATATVQDMRARYELGARILELREEEGPHGIVAGLATVLDVDASLVRRFARTCQVIGAAEFEWFTRLRTITGKAVAWSQLEILAREASKAQRRQLALAIVREDLSVRALIKRMARRPARVARVGALAPWRTLDGRTRSSRRA